MEVIRERHQITWSIPGKQSIPTTESEQTTSPIATYTVEPVNNSHTP